MRFAQGKSQPPQEGACRRLTGWSDVSPSTRSASLAYSFHSSVRSGSADTSPRLSHDTENNCNVTHPTRLRYNRCKPGLGPRQRVLGAAAPDAAVSEAAAYMVEAVATSMAGPPRERLPRTRSSRTKLRWVRDRGRSRPREVRRLLAHLGTHAGFTPPRNSRLCLAKALRS